jgi:hypothetical protein
MSYATIKTKLLSIAKGISSLKDTYAAATISFDTTTHKIMTARAVLISCSPMT